MGIHDRVFCDIGDRHAFALHVFRQSKDHRAGSARCRGLECACDHFRNAFGLVDLGHPFGHLPEHPPIIDFLKRLPLRVIPVDLTNQQDHRCRRLGGRVHTDARMARARSPGDQANARPAGEFAICLGHVRCTGLVATGNESDFIGNVVQGIENFEIAFAWHAESDVHAVTAQGINEDAPARARGLGRCHVAGSRQCLGVAPQLRAVANTCQPTAAWPAQFGKPIADHIAVRRFPSGCGPAQPETPR